MKKIVVLLSLIVTSVLFANSFEPKESVGKMFYKDETNKISKSDVSLYYDSEGDGGIRINCEKHGEMLAEAIIVKRSAGRPVVYLVFPNPKSSEIEGKEEHTKLVLKGTYLKGENMAIYYGDFFEVSGHHEFTGDELGGHSWNYLGGFGFKNVTPMSFIEK